MAAAAGARGLRGARAGPEEPRERRRSEGRLLRPRRRLVLAAVDGGHVVLDVGHLVEDLGAHGAREGVARVDLLVARERDARAEPLAALRTREPRPVHGQGPAAHRHRRLRRRPARAHHDVAHAREGGVGEALQVAEGRHRGRAEGGPRRNLRDSSCGGGRC